MTNNKKKMKLEDSNRHKYPLLLIQLYCPHSKAYFFNHRLHFNQHFIHRWGIFLSSLMLQLPWWCVPKWIKLGNKIMYLKVVRMTSAWYWSGWFVPSDRETKVFLWCSIKYKCVSVRKIIVVTIKRTATLKNPYRQDWANDRSTGISWKLLTVLFHVHLYIPTEIKLKKNPSQRVGLE